MLGFRRAPVKRAPLKLFSPKKVTQTKTRSGGLRSFNISARKNLSYASIQNRSASVMHVKRHVAGLHGLGVNTQGMISSKYSPSISKQSFPVRSIPTNRTLTTVESAVRSRYSAATGKTEPSVKVPVGTTSAGSRAVTTAMAKIGGTVLGSALVKPALAAGVGIGGTIVIAKAIEGFMRKRQEQAADGTGVAGPLNLKGLFSKKAGGKKKKSKKTKKSKKQKKSGKGRKPKYKQIRRKTGAKRHPVTGQKARPGKKWVSVSKKRPKGWGYYGKKQVKMYK